MRCSRLLALAVLALGCSRSSADRPSDKPRASSTLPTAMVTTVSSAAATKRIVDPGAEPREKLPTFEFVKGRTEGAHLVIDSRLEHADKTFDEHLDVQLDVQYVSTNTVELVVRRATTTAPDIARIGTTVGTKFVQKMAPTGEADPPEVSYPQTVDAIAGDYVRGAVVQVASNFLPVTPNEPVGKGARWVLHDLRYAFIERRGNVYVVERRGEYQGNRMTNAGMTLVREAQRYRMDAVKDGLARRVEAELVSESLSGTHTKRTTRIAFEVTAAK